MASPFNHKNSFIVSPILILGGLLLLWAFNIINFSSFLGCVVAVTMGCYGIYKAKKNLSR